MDIVLGVSLTPKTVRMALVEGEKGDGAIVDHDSFEVSESEGSATPSAADQVVAAILGTQESAVEGGHVLKAIGVTWSDRAEAAQLRDALAARGISDAMLVSELHAAGALAQAAGRAVGYERTGLLFLDRDSATLSVVNSDDGSIVKVVSRNLHSTDALAVLADMVAAVDAQDSPPQGMFVVGSGVEIASVTAHLEDLVDMPVKAPEESGLALARGAALAAANAPAYDATTAGLAYSQDPATGSYLALAGADTVLRPEAADVDDLYDDDDYPAPPTEGRKPFLLVGSALTSIFVVGFVALAISLAVSIRPTVDQRPDPGQAAIVPEAAPPAAPPVLDPPAAQVPAPAPAPAPPAETIKPPVPVVQQQPAPQAPPRTVYVEAPQAAPQAPPPAAPAPVVPPPVVAPPPVPQVLPAPNPFVPTWRPPSVYNPPSYYPPNQNNWPQRPQWQNPFPQRPDRGDDDWPQRPPRGNDDWPQQPQPAPQWPGQGGGNGGDGGRGGYGGGGGGQGGHGGGPSICFLNFCSG